LEGDAAADGVAVGEIEPVGVELAEIEIDTLPVMEIETVPVIETLAVTLTLQLGDPDGVIVGGMD